MRRAVGDGYRGLRAAGLRVGRYTSPHLIHLEERFAVNGQPVGSATLVEAIERVRGVCETHLQGRYELQVVDIYQKPALARDEQILATPTLIKVLPAPLRRFIGNLANVEKVLFGLDLREKR